ncbi:MAG: peptide chain release factor 3 [Myxococcota bacterium]
MMSQNSKQVQRRRTFAIISHPDAGKTTLTEKLLLYGGAIHLAGSVKARRNARHATSDWMELERQRGISVTSSVLQFEYEGLAINLLDTPGHRDFSEDTYRTLAAADSAVMLIDCAKGVEEQTRKLFEVCRLRGIPIFTFVNKMDRHGREPLELMEELEEVLGIRSCPLNWPMGLGNRFKGVYDRRKRAMFLYDSQGRHGESMVNAQEASPEDERIRGMLGEATHEEFMEEIELLDVAGDPFDRERVLAGELTPMFFGSALNNFGVEQFLSDFIDISPPPAARISSVGPIAPEAETFSGFIFKIQANMNPAHRDRIAFLRICSGRFEAGMSVYHPRRGREIQLADAHQFMAQQRTHVTEAYAGDIVGLYDTGTFRIGDTLVQNGPKALRYNELRRFSPEHFARVRTQKALRRKQLEKGLQHLADEGTIQVFRSVQSGLVEPIVGAVGVLQFEVLKYRLKAEYGVEARLDNLPYTCARWVRGEGFDPTSYAGRESTSCVMDRDNNPLLLLRNEWSLQWIKNDHPGLEFFAYAPDGKEVEADA